MRALAFFATTTGLHLAILQFSYFFMLMLNITSTYVTYMTLVISWMAGTVAGLFWRNLQGGIALAIGVAAYYTICVLVISDPLRDYLLPIAAVGVAASGLWAGRFFVVLLPLFESPDKLFLHENNGFLVGIIGVFVGFSLLSQGFLLWAPALSLAVLYLQMAVLRHRRGHVELALLPDRTNPQ